MSYFKCIFYNIVRMCIVKYYETRGWTFISTYLPTHVPPHFVRNYILWSASGVSVCGVLNLGCFSFFLQIQIEHFYSIFECVVRHLLKINLYSIF